MAILVWVTLGIALWHFTVFVPDRFRGGIVGAFIASVIGAVVTGALWQLAIGEGIGETDVLTVFAAVPGYFIANAIAYWLGVRDEESRDAAY